MFCLQKKRAKKMLELVEEEKKREKKESIEISVITDRDGGVGGQQRLPRPSFIFNENIGE